MGNTLGNILGLLAVALPVGIGLLISFRTGAITHVALSYGAWLLLRLMTATVTPRRDIPFLVGLSDDEARVFRRYFVALTHPNAGELYSAGLNVTRIVGCLWAVVCFFRDFYVLGGVLALFFFVSGRLIMTPPKVLSTRRRTAAARRSRRRALVARCSAGEAAPLLCRASTDTNVPDARVRERRITSRRSCRALRARSSEAQPLCERNQLFTCVT